MVTSESQQLCSIDSEKYLLVYERSVYDLRAKSENETVSNTGEGRESAEYL